jgi:hypothetical protein
MRRVISVLAISTCLLAGLPMTTWANGVTIFSGLDRNEELPVSFDFGGERYYLKIPAKKMKVPVAEFAITYPNYYTGQLDPKSVEVQVSNQKVPAEVTWNAKGRRLEISPKDPIPAGQTVQLILSNVQNPPFGGTYYVTCEIQSSSPGALPLYSYLGTWIIQLS